MEDINKVFTIQWVGPFENFESCKAYLRNKDTCPANLFNFYYCYGSKKGKGYPKRKKYTYFGLHKADTPIGERVNKRHEHLSKFREPFSLWIGSFSNCDNKNEQNVEDVETLFISTYPEWLTENRLKKKAKPIESICIINLWYKPGEERWLNKKGEIQVFDDVLVYEKEWNKFSKGRLR